LVLGKSVNRKIVKHDFLYLSDVELKRFQKKEFTFSRKFGIPVRFHDYLNIIEGGNIDLIEFHLTFNDLSADLSKLKPVKGIQKVVVHAPELFGQDHILDLASNDSDYLDQSTRYLIDVVRVTENIKELMQYSSPIEVVVNVGGFSEAAFISVDLRKSLYEKVAENYFFDELFFDSDLEKINSKTAIKEVTIFTKIPKNSIKIPVAGGKSYSPDFAYVLNFEDGKKKLHFIVETKNVRNENDLREEEKQKIRHAEKFFGDAVKIEFKTQFTSDKIVDLIKEISKV
jgi:hypothetical protein